MGKTENPSILSNAQLRNPIKRQKSNTTDTPCEAHMQAACERNKANMRAATVLECAPTVHPTQS